MNDLFNQPDSPSKERIIEILIEMADYLSKGEIVEYSNNTRSLYSLIIDGVAIGGLCSLLMSLEISKFMTPYEVNIVTSNLKEELIQSRGGIQSAFLSGSYWFEPMTSRESKEAVVRAQSERLEFLHKVTIKLQNS